MRFKEMNTPNKLTTIRMICVPVVILLFLLYVLHIQFGWKTDFDLLNGNAQLTITQILIFVLFTFASITDFVDGYLARKNNIVSDYGKMMDPLADKLLVNTTLICLGFFGFFHSYNVSGNTRGIFSILLSLSAILVIFRDFFVDSLRMQSVKKGIVVPASWWGKYKTATLMPGIALLIIASAHVVLFYIGAVLVILGGVFAIIGGVQYFNSIMPTLDK